MANEQLRPGPKLFPLGDYTSRTAVARFFPGGAVQARRDEAASAFQKEEDIIALHYKGAHTFTLAVPELIKLQIGADDGYVRLGMKFLHGAARIEAETKRAQLPKIDESQLIDYLVLKSTPVKTDEKLEFSSALYKDILEVFKLKELSLQRALPVFLTYQQDFLMGAAFMRDFLITAPTL